MAKAPKTNDIEFWKTGSKPYKEGIRKELKDKDHIDKWVLKILENAPEKEKLRILDVGTGPGFFTITLTKEGHDVTGIDVTPEMVQAAKDNAAEQGLTCDFRQMDAGELDFPDEIFDLIISRNVTWTLPDMYETYREWRRVLAPNGRIIVFDANYYLNHFDPESAKVLHREMRWNVRNGARRYNERHDFHIRWSYWEDRPMIGTERPTWDRNMLHKLRFMDITIEENLFGEQYPSKGSWSPMFMIRATKPNAITESKYIMHEYWEGISGVFSGETAEYIEKGCAGELLDSMYQDLKGKRVLDVGTGSGLLAIATEGKGADVVGIDLSEEMVEMAQLTAEELESDAEFVQMDAENMEFEDASFDIVFIRNVLSNSPCPENIIKEVSRVVAPGGKVIVEDAPWISRIDAWRKSASDDSAFPNYLQRDLGFGCRDVIDATMRKLPMADPDHRLWKSEAFTEYGFVVDSEEKFADKIIAEYSEILGEPCCMVLTRSA